MDLDHNTPELNIGSRVIPVDPFDLVVFGGTGDLALGKILPALVRRFCAGQVPEGSRIIGAARAELSPDAYRRMLRETLIAAGSGPGPVDRFLASVDYVPLDATEARGWDALGRRLDRDRVRAFYLSVGPGLFGRLAERVRAGVW